MKKSLMIIAGAMLSVLCPRCARVNYETVRTPVSTVKKDKAIQFSIDSDPRGASTYVDSVAVGPTPVTVQTTYPCSEVTYKTESVFKARKTALDITGGSIMLGSAVLAAALLGAKMDDTAHDAAIAVGIMTAGLGAAGLALIIRGIVLKAKNGKVRSSQEKVVQECPSKTWNLVLAKDNFMPAERVLKFSDANKTTMVTLTPATVLSSPTPPPAALDKTALLSSMASKTEALSGEDATLSADSKKIVEERMKNLASYISVGKDYEAAGDDLYIPIEANEIKMFEMTTEKDYCYIISAVGEHGSPLYMAVFRGEEEIAKDFKGTDIATVQFCSDSSEPVRVTTSSEANTTVALRIYFLAK
jgi:hypothetical protein